ncbi:hypothetical protein Tco_0599803 [Tanacetum coccineum]
MDAGGNVPILVVEMDRGNVPTRSVVIGSGGNVPTSARVRVGSNWYLWWEACRIVCEKKVRYSIENVPNTLLIERIEHEAKMMDGLLTSIWRDVRTLAIEEAYTTKYSIHPGADTMLCGFRLTNRWLSMKKDIASCGSKYLAYSEVEVEYQGSSGLLLQPELPE